MLPDGSGIDWLRGRRQRGDTTPALVLTARDRLEDRVHGLDSGGDDYLVKPFAPEELAARLRAVSRRAAGGAAARRAFGAVDVDLGARAAYLDGERVDLTGREWAVLEALVLRAGRIVAKADLEKIVLGFDAELASNALEVHVSALRESSAVRSSRRCATSATGSVPRHESVGVAFDRRPAGALAGAVVRAVVRRARRGGMGDRAGGGRGATSTTRCRARPKA